VQAESSLDNLYSIPAKALSLPAELQGCGYNMTPTCIKAMYDIPDATKARKGNSLGLYEQGDYFAKSDLDLFYKEYAPWVPQGTYPIPALIDGANYSVPADSSLNTGESDIDIDMAWVESFKSVLDAFMSALANGTSRFALIYPQTVTLYQVDDQLYEPEEVATTNLFNTFLDALDGVCPTFYVENIRLILPVLLHIQRLRRDWRRPQH
jgi:tripeptidyl-peptidase-1